jgi:aryl sulfotransferase
VLLLHFENLKNDMPGEIRRVAEFLEIDVDDYKWPDILKHCSFDYMKANATATVPLGGAFWDGGAQTFINKGVNGRWREVLSPEETATYEQRAVAELGAPCARWLTSGALR